MSRHPRLVVQNLVSGQEIDLAFGAKLAVPAQKGGRYRVFDKETGEAVADARVGLDGSDLLIVVEEEQAALRLEGFEQEGGSFVAEGADADGQAVEQAVTAQELESLALGSGASDTAGVSGQTGTVIPDGLAGIAMPILFGSGILALVVASSKNSNTDHGHDLGPVGAVGVSMDMPDLGGRELSGKEVFENGLTLSGSLAHAQGARVVVFANGEPIPGAVVRPEGGHWMLHLTPSQLQGLHLKDGQSLELRAEAQNDLGETLASCAPIEVGVGHIDLPTPQPNPDPGTNPKPDPDPGTNPDPKPKPDPDPGTNPTPKPKPDPDPGTNQSPYKIDSIAEDNAIDYGERFHGFSIKTHFPDVDAKQQFKIVFEGKGQLASQHVYMLNPDADSQENAPVFSIKSDHLSGSGLNLQPGALYDVTVFAKVNGKEVSAKLKGLKALDEPVLSITHVGDGRNITHENLGKPVKVKLKLKNYGQWGDDDQVAIHVENPANGETVDVALKPDQKPDGKGAFAVTLQPDQLAGLKVGADDAALKFSASVPSKNPQDLKPISTAKEINVTIGDAPALAENALVAHGSEPASEAAHALYEITDKPGAEEKNVTFALSGGQKFNGGEQATLTVNGKVVATATAKAGQNTVSFDGAEKAIAKELHEDSVSIVKAVIQTPTGPQTAEMPVVLNNKPGEDRTLLDTTLDHASGNTQATTLKPDLIDKAEANANVKDGHLTVGGSAQGLEDGQSIAAVVGKAAFVAHAKDGKWSLDLDESQLKAALGTDSLDAEAIHGKTLVIQTFVPGDGGKLQAYSQNSLTLDVCPAISANPFTGDNILSLSELDAAQAFSGSAKHADGMTVEIWKTDARGNQGEKIGETTVRDGAWSFDAQKEDLRAWENEKGFGLTAKLIDEDRQTLDAASVNVNSPAWSGMVNVQGIRATERDTTFAQAVRNYKLIQEHDRIDVEGLRSFPDANDAQWTEKGGGQKMPEGFMTYPETANAANGLSAINAFRSFNQTDGVTLSGRADVVESAQKAAIAMASEGRIDHGLTGFKHFDKDASNASNSSVLGMGGVKGDVSGYVSDDYNAVGLNLGHRMQILSPNMRETAPGYAVGDGNTVFTAYNTFNSVPWKPTLTHAPKDYAQAYKPNTLEWPAAGYFPYALVPQKMWSFQVGDPNGGDFKLLGVRVFKNGEEIRVSNAMLQDNNYDVSHSYSTTVSFMPHLSDRSFSGSRWSKGAKGIDKPIFAGQKADGSLATDDYEVAIDTDKGLFTYTVKVFDETALPQATGLRAASATFSEETGSAVEPDLQHLPPVEHGAHRATANGEDVEFGDKLDLTDRAGGSDGGVDFASAGLTGSTVNLGSADDRVEIAGDFAADLSLGSGDDAASLGKMVGGRIDGGDGSDTVAFTQAGNVVNLSRFANVETIDLGRPAAEGELFNIIQIDAEGMEANGGKIEIKGGAGNKAALKEGTIASAREYVDDFGEAQVELEYCVNGSAYRIDMSANLYDGGAGIL